MIKNDKLRIIILNTQEINFELGRKLFFWKKKFINSKKKWIHSKIKWAFMIKFLLIIMTH